MPSRARPRSRAETYKAWCGAPDAGAAQALLAAIYNEAYLYTTRAYENSTADLEDLMKWLGDMISAIEDTTPTEVGELDE